MSDSAEFPDRSLYGTAEIRAVEAHAFAQPEPPPLMERAGAAVAELARTLLPAGGTSVLVLAGPGNNGGDAFVAARHLRAGFHRVAVVFAGDPFRLSDDARRAYEAWRDAGGDTHDLVPGDHRWDLVIDGLFGIGLTRPLEGKAAELISFINDVGAPVVAIDVPSGLDAATGRVMGRAVRAAHTVTFLGLKPGLFTLDGPDHCGQVHLERLGVDAAAIAAARGRLADASELRGALEPRPANSHKGLFGSVGIVGGAAGMVGAGLLAARAALKAGSGRVHLGLMAGDAPLVDPVHPEIMVRGADAVLKLPGLDVLAVGPGLGQSAGARTLLKTAVKCPCPLVLDADALNVLAQEALIRRPLVRRNAPTVLTPHPAEAARLLGSETAAVQRDRVAAAVELAARFDAEVVLKGAGSVCASPDGSWSVNPTGNAGLAAAGQGDVLTGLVAALIGQHVPAPRALRAAVWLHGAAADRLVARGVGPVGLTAGEIADAARDVLNDRS